MPPSSRPRPRTDDINRKLSAKFNVRMKAASTRKSTARSRSSTNADRAEKTSELKQSSARPTSKHSRAPSVAYVSPSATSVEERQPEISIDLRRLKRKFRNLKCAFVKRSATVGVVGSGMRTFGDPLLGMRIDYDEPDHLPSWCRPGVVDGASIGKKM